jgi:hypothetical protein
VSDPRAPGASGPGEVPPPGLRHLERPPGERFAVTDGAASEGETAGRPRLARGLAFGALAAVGGSLVWLVAAGVLDLSGGLIVVAGVLAWAIGAAVRAGTWSSAAHAPDGRSGVSAIALGLLTWLGGTFLVYLYALATLPASSVSFAERLAAQPFLDWLAPQVVPLAPVELAAFVLVGWFAAR